MLNASGSNENVFRYVVDLAADSFFVRDGVTTTDANGRTAVWKLYRIPIRKPSATIGTPNIRLVKHLRMTVAAPPDNGDARHRGPVALWRGCGSSGSPWVRRAETPIAGLSGAIGLPHGDIVTRVVSTENARPRLRVAPGPP